MAEQLSENKYFVIIYITKGCNLKCKYCIQDYKTKDKMDVDTAKTILRKEIGIANQLNKQVFLRFMGGEPLMNFDLIRDVCEWLWLEYQNIKIDISLRTNGTLLNDTMKQWFSEHVAQLSCGPSIDGIAEVNRINRGMNKDVKDFFFKNWPEYGAHGTLFPDSVEHLYDSVLFFNDLNYKFDIKIGLGTLWTEHHADILEQEMDKLCHYYLDNPNLTPVSVFFKDLTFFGKPPQANDYNCLSNHGGAVYDVDGKQYSCEVLMPLVLGKENVAKIEQLGNLPREYAIDEICQTCPFIVGCPTCPSMNYKYTGDFKKSATLVTTCKATKVQFKMTAYLMMLKYEHKVLAGEKVSEDLQSNIYPAMEVLNYFH